MKILILLLLLILLSGCDSTTWQEQLADGIKKAFMETWWFWLIIIFIILIIGILTSMIKIKARKKLANKINKKIKDRRKK